MLKTRDALSDAINATGNSVGLVAAQTGKSGAAYQASAEAGQQILAAGKLAEQHIESKNDGPSVDGPTGNAGLLKGLTAGAVVVAGITAVAPALGAAAATIGLAHSAHSMAKSLGNSSGEKSFFNDVDADKDDGASYESASSAPSRGIELQETENLPVMEAQQDSYQCFADSLDESIAEKGQDQVLAEVTEGPTIKAAEGQIKFSIEQLAELEIESPRPYIPTPSAPMPMMG